MNNKIKEALVAFANRKMKIDIPNFDFSVYIRPIPYANMFEICANEEGETEEEREDAIDMALSAFSMVDEDDNQIFKADEYADWIKKVDYKTALAIVKARNSLNNFTGLDSADKKKL